MKKLSGIFLIALCSIFAVEDIAITASGERPIEEEVFFRCRVIAITGQYTHLGSRYEVKGACYTDNEVVWNWNSQGAYRKQGGKTEDTIVFTATGLNGGRVDAQMQCDQDPWIEPSTCINPTSRATGEILYSSITLRGIQDTIEHTKKPLSTSLRSLTGYTYDHGALLAQRDADLQAEAAAARAAQAAEDAAALQRQNKRLNKAVRPGPPRFAPTIISPAASALFLSNTSVPIKIAPPQEITATGYMVRVETRNAQGIWTLVTNLPVSAAEASSPSGYLGWGAPGPGRGAAMIAGPGAYRASAQVSAPRPTAWSQPVEFVVTSPQKAIQKAPRMFGQ